MDYRQRGLSAIGALIVAIVIGIAGFAIWFKWYGDQQSVKSETLKSLNNEDTAPTDTTPSSP